jgi:hypothetical protein
MNNEREMGAAKVTRKDFLNERGELKAENGANKKKWCQ